MDDCFEYAIKKVLEFEGGYVNDPNDPGGETKYGISKRAYPDLDIKNLTVEQAKEIYYRDYWIKAKCNQLPKGVNVYHFDTAVNMGFRRAGKLLQKAYNTVRMKSELLVDGIVGPKTLYAVKMVDPFELLFEYARLRSSYYENLAERRKSLKKFLNGWLRRSRQMFCYAARKIVEG